MMIIRTYQCLRCNLMFDVQMETGDDPDPPCPDCDVVLQWVPSRIAIKTHKSRAIDYAQKVAEEDYGLTDMNDGSREGDIAAKLPVETQAKRDEIVKIEREIAEMAQQAHLPPVNAQLSNRPPSAFWGGGGGAPTPASQVTAQALLASAKMGPAADVNPMTMLQQGIKDGAIPRRERIVARWKP